MLLVPAVWAQRGRAASTSSRSTTLSYDVSASTGSYNGFSYSEIHLGLNWGFNEYIVWRNSVFSRFGSYIETVNGLDSSLRFVFDTRTEDGGLGLALFGGPGYRFATAKNSAAFGEAGISLLFGGLRIGFGVKSFYYADPGQDSLGRNLPKTDTNYFIILAGGGTL